MSEEKQVVIVTGGAQGIGFGICSCFAKKGASVVIADVDQSAAQKSADELNGMGGQDCIGLKCDVTVREQVASMIDRVCDRYGRLDVLCNNAGISPFIDIMELEPDTWQKTIDINLTGPFHCSQLAAKKMIEYGNGGSLVFTTSLAENLSNNRQVHYGASKGGLRMLMVGLAASLGEHGINCNAIAPGHILTPMTPHWSNPDNIEKLKERLPIQRVGTPEDIGNAAVFLASKEAEYITGITIRVDGGFQTRSV